MARNTPRHGDVVARYATADARATGGSFARYAMGFIPMTMPKEGSVVGHGAADYYYG